MGLIKLIAAPIRNIVGFPLFQLAVVIAIILVLQAADDNSVFGRIYSGLDKLVDFGIQLCGQVFEVKSFTKSWLTLGLMIGYVYLVGLVALSIVRRLIGRCVDVLGAHNALGLRSTIARERGVAAYRAWLPLERIRPKHIPQDQWEKTFAWPANDRPPYAPLPQRVFIGILSYLIVFLAVAAILQIWTPFPALTWIGKLLHIPAV
jgi:hypothetical protein